VNPISRGRANGLPTAYADKVALPAFVRRNSRMLCAVQQSIDYVVPAAGLQQQSLLACWDGQTDARTMHKRIEVLRRCAYAVLHLAPLVDWDLYRQLAAQIKNVHT